MTMSRAPHYRCYVWSETQAKVVEFSQVRCMSLTIYQVNMNHCRLIVSGQGPVLRHQINQVRCPHCHDVTDPRDSGKLQRTPHNGSLSRAGSMSSINLDTWDVMEAEAGDEKDRRIRELEETLRKQKELMEILQRKLNDTPSSVRSQSHILIN